VEAALGVGDLAVRDRVDPGLEGKSTMLIARQPAEYGDADLLGDVVRELTAAGVRRQPGPAVAMGDHMDLAHQVVDRQLVAFGGPPCEA
jgi:hypothetical protein